MTNASLFAPAAALLSKSYLVNVVLFLLVDVTEDVVFGVAEYLYGNSEVVVLQRRHVVVANCQLRFRVDLISASAEQVLW